MEDTTGTTLLSPGDNSSPQAITALTPLLLAQISDLRVTGDQWSRSRLRATQQITEWDTKGLGELFPDTTDPLPALPDGTVLCGRDLHDIIRVCRIVVGFCEMPNSNEIALLDFGGRIPGHSITRVAVNGAFPK